MQISFDDETVFVQTGASAASSSTSGPSELLLLSRDAALARRNYEEHKRIAIEARRKYKEARSIAENNAKQILLHALENDNELAMRGEGVGECRSALRILSDIEKSYDRDHLLEQSDDDVQPTQKKRKVAAVGTAAEITKKEGRIKQQ